MRHLPRLASRIWRRRVAFWSGAVAVGAVSVLFAQAADGAEQIFFHATHKFWALPLIITPLGFLFCAWAAASVFPGSQGSGIPQAIAARQLPRGVARRRLLSVRLCFAKIGLTVVGLLCGASVGREGPTVQVGATIMLQVARMRGLQNERGLILAGSAAGIAAAFNAPLAGVVFAIEEMSRSFEVKTNGLVLTTVIIGGLVSLGLTGDYTYFGSSDAAVRGLGGWVLTAFCGSAGGLLGGLFSRLMMDLSAWARGWMSANPKFRRLIYPFCCGLLVAGIGIVTKGDSFGTGYQTARAAVEGVAPHWYFWPAKFLTTLITAISGMPGGIFAPSLSVGAGLGAWIAGAGGHAASLGAMLGMAGYFAGVVQAPMTAFVIILEMTGNTGAAIPVMVAAMLGLGTSRLVCPRPLYHELAHGFLQQQHITLRRPGGQDEPA
ncbi:MAG: chloride channel protein [Proteobacteria bacterium]|nr:chloride channel protein [Pseudomonadota bacterium]MBU6425905.1 chloride channel protein [Rhodospirillales bacterium]